MARSRDDDAPEGEGVGAVQDEHDEADSDAPEEALLHGHYLGQSQLLPVLGRQCILSVKGHYCADVAQCLHVQNGDLLRTMSFTLFGAKV